MRSQDAFIELSNTQLVAYWQDWVADLYGKRVRVTVEVLEEVVTMTTRCPDCDVELPEQESYEIHREHACPVFKIRKVGWENSFMVDYDNSTPGEWSILDAECERVCIAPSVEAAEVIKAALDEYWARRNL